MIAVTMWRIITQMNIFEKMSAIAQEIETVGKNLSVGTGKSAYKAVSEADVLMAVKPVEAKYKVYSYPISREIVDSGEIVSQGTSYDGKKYDKKQLYLRVKTVYRFVNIEMPNEYIDVPTYGDGVDTGDKAPGKAMTYADKYALLKAYKIQTGEDPDQNASEPLQSMKKGTVKKEAAYPSATEMLNDIGAYIKTDKSALNLLMEEAARVNADTILDLAKAKPDLIKALWNKWCNK